MSSGFTLTTTGKFSARNMTISQKKQVFTSIDRNRRKSSKTLFRRFLCRSRMCAGSNLVCGKRGIRTPGTSRFNGFQDRRNRPLCHLSGDKSSTLFPFYQIPAGISPRALPACGGRRTAFLNGRARLRFRPAACPLSVFLPCVARAVAVSLCRRGKRSKRMFGKFLLTLSDTVRISRRRML